VPLHIEADDGVAVITGAGSTVTAAVAEAVQLLAVPIMVYVAVPAVLLLLLDKVSAIGVPPPELAPLIPAVSTALHA
jgi:hypothetical protein